MYIYIYIHNFPCLFPVIRTCQADWNTYTWPIYSSLGHRSIFCGVSVVCGRDAVNPALSKGQGQLWVMEYDWRLKWSATPKIFHHPQWELKKIALGLCGVLHFFWLVVGPLHWWWPEAGLIWSRHVSSGCCLSSQAHVSLLCFQSCNRNARNVRLGNRPSPPSGFLADLMSSPVPGWRTVSSEVYGHLLI